MTLFLSLESEKSVSLRKEITAQPQMYEEDLKTASRADVESAGAGARNPAISTWSPTTESPKTIFRRLKRLERL
jgi:hypothetical protein